jgi:hypothetical protein
MDTHQDTKLSATSIAPKANNSTTPGVVHAHDSSMKSQQAFQKNGLADGPMYFPEDDEKLALDVEQELVSSNKRATKKTNAVMAIADEKLLKKTGTRSDIRQEHRRARIVARTTGEDTAMPPSAVFPSQEEAEQDPYGNAKQKTTDINSTDAVTMMTDITDEKVKRTGTRSDIRQEHRRARIVARTSPTQNVEQDNDDGDEEDVAPGAVRVGGKQFTSRVGDEEDGRTSIIMPQEEEEELTTTAAYSTRQLILEAQLVVEEEDTERGLDQKKRDQIEEELRHKFQKELGRVAQAEVVGETQPDSVLEDHGRKTRSRALLCTGIVMVILLAVILGIVLGMRDSNDKPPPPKIPPNNTNQTLPP